MEALTRSWGADRRDTHCGEGPEERNGHMTEYESLQILSQATVRAKVTFEV